MPIYASSAALPNSLLLRQRPPIRRLPQTDRLLNDLVQQSRWVLEAQRPALRQALQAYHKAVQEQPGRPFRVVIAGGVGSGKASIAQDLNAALARMAGPLSRSTPIEILVGADALKASYQDRTPPDLALYVFCDPTERDRRLRARGVPDPQSLPDVRQHCDRIAPQMRLAHLIVDGSLHAHERQAAIDTLARLIQQTTEQAATYRD